MSTDVSLSHTIDDDITFEKVRHMPRRTQFVSTHRQLTWQHEKMLKQHERDQRLSHSELSRAKTLMADKLTRLQGVKKQMERQKGEPANVGRQDSVPGLENLETATASAKRPRESSMPVTSIPSGSSGPRPATKQSSSTLATKSLRHQPAFGSVMTNIKQPYPALSKPAGQTASTPHRVSKQFTSALAQHSAHFDDDSNSKEVNNCPADGRGYRRVRILSLTPATGGSGDGPDWDLQSRRIARRATIAEGARETSTLPPHLLQKLAEFMDNTEAFLLAPPARATPRGSNDDSGNKDSSGLRKSQSAGQLYHLDLAEGQQDEQPDVDAVTD